MFAVYTVRVIHTFCASPNLTDPILRHAARSSHNIQHHKSDPFRLSEGEWVERGWRRAAVAWSGTAVHTPTWSRETQKRKAESALVDMMRWIILFSCFSFSSVFIILLPFASAYAWVGNVMMFCMFRLGFFAFTSPPVFWCLCYCINLYSFYYTQGSRTGVFTRAGGRGGEENFLSFSG